MNHVFLVIVLVLFILFLIPAQYIYGQIPVPEGCEKQTISSVLYRPVNLNIVHDKAFKIDPIFIIPPDQQSINRITPYENSEGRINAGFVINGTGTHTITYAIEHAGFKETPRILDVFLQTAGLPMLALQESYTGKSICKVYELQITDKPLIPTEEEIVQVAYGIITPIIKNVGVAVDLNTDQSQRTSDRQGIALLAIIILIAIMIFKWHSKSKEKDEVVEDYNLINQRLRNQESSQIVSNFQFTKDSKKILNHQREVLKDFQMMFNLQMDFKIKDFAFILRHFWKELNNYGMKIPEYEIPDVIPIITHTNPSSLNYIPPPVELDYDFKQKTTTLDFITEQLKSDVEVEDIKKISTKILSILKRKSRSKQTEDYKDNLEELYKTYRKLMAIYEAEPEGTPRKNDLDANLNELYDKIKEAEVGSA